jgi:hypothetical protein
MRPKDLRGRNGGAWKGSKALDIHLLGAAGEVAVASYLGMKEHFFIRTRRLTEGKSDDLPGIDVKTRRRDAMKEEFWADPARGRPAYFVTKEHLRPMESLNDEAQML